MSLSTQIAADVSSVFLNTDDFAVSIIYRAEHGDQYLTAMVDSSTFETSNQFGVTSFETRDYLIAATDVVVMPERGDQIIEGGRVYIVTNPAGQPAWQYDDENQLLVRIHTTLQVAVP